MKSYYCCAGGSCVSFWYHIIDHSGALRVSQSIGDSWNVLEERPRWYQASVQQDEWRLGYAEMLPTAYNWRVVFEAERGKTF